MHYVSKFWAEISLGNLLVSLDQIVAHNFAVNWVFIGITNTIVCTTCIHGIPKRDTLYIVMVLLKLLWVLESYARR